MAFGTAAAVIGLALMTIGVSRSTPGVNLLTSAWFDSGLGLLAIGGVLLLWALGLYLAHRRHAGERATAGSRTDTEGERRRKPSDVMTEAVRGYYAERDKLIKMWDRQERDRRRKQ